MCPHADIFQPCLSMEQLVIVVLDFFSLHKRIFHLHYKYRRRRPSRKLCLSAPVNTDATNVTWHRFSLTVIYGCDTDGKSKVHFSIGTPRHHQQPRLPPECRNATQSALMPALEFIRECRILLSFGKSADKMFFCSHEWAQNGYGGGGGGGGDVVAQW